MNHKQQTFFCVEVKTDLQTTDAIEFALSECGADGTEIDLLGKKNVETISVKGYFSENPDREFISKKIYEALEIYDFPNNLVKEVLFNEFENQDWLAEWKKNWKPIEVANFIVAPTWSELQNVDNKIIIRIEPGMAFGTGTHETTKLCLKAIAENYQGGSVFDVGTGTGILAIAIAKSKIKNQKSKILACDTDEDSIPIARENAELNDIHDIDFYVGSIEENSPECDFVLANLTADVIIPLLPLLVAKARQTLVLSGILVEQKDKVCEVFEPKFQIPQSKLKIETDGMWISIVYHKN